MSGALVEIEGLTAGYDVPVVGPVSFTIREGEIVVLTGPNGTGKSTLLGALVGAVHVFSGEIRKAPGLRIEIQIQRPVRTPEMPLTAREFLRLTGADSRAGSMVKPIFRRRVDTLSAGQFQLLTVLACLGSPARLVLLDEPINNMDRPSVEVLQRMLAADRGNRGVLIVSHEAGFVSGISSRVMEIGS
jgi:zinc transport system ATP-binding protein